MNPDYDDWLNEIKWLEAEGFKGVKFHADYQGYFVDDLCMLNIYEKN